MRSKTLNLAQTSLGLDIGPDSAKIFAEAVSSSTTVFWNGPMGVFEFPNFAHGTKAVAEALTNVNGLSVVGGGGLSRCGQSAWI